MNKVEFIKTMTKLILLKKDEGDLRTAFKKFDPDWCDISFGRYETLVVDTLKETMNDKSDWIGWWIYETDCGKKTKLTNSVRSKTGKKLPCKTLGDLYNIITKK